VTLLAALALAAALPARPAPRAPAPGDCPAVEPLRPGPVTRACSSLSVPPSEYADLLAAEAWGEATSDLCRVELAGMADRLDACAERADYWRRAAEAPPARLSPVAAFGLGVGAGVATVLLSAVAVRWAASVEVTG